MKQLLDTRNITIKKDDNELYHVTGTIIALDNHAYVILEEQDKDINNMNYTTYELLSCNNSTTVVNDNEDTNNNKEKENNDNKDTSNNKEKESSKTNNTKEKDNDNDDTIESCCIYMTKGKESLDIYCGVAYKNKLLYIYHIPTSTCTSTPTPMADNPQDKSVIKIKPIIKYNTVRKVCSISFNTITDTRESKEESTNINNMGIFIADLQGDVTSYPLTTNNSKRILLGHTASILTGMKISNSSSNAQKGRKIITCDRDEKIRISSFPNCWYTLGYLLGHTDYISCIDIATTDDGTNICVSCSGDGTIKLWDYDTYKLLDTYPITTTTTNDNDNSDDENKNDDCSNDANYVYSYVSIHKSGKYIAAIKQQQQNANESTNGHNNNPIIELFTIEKNTTLKLMQTISSSMESLPISLLFLPSSKNNTVNDDNISLIVLCTQPNYILHYKYIPSSTNALFQDISSHKSYYHTVISKLGNENNITMPIESTRSNSNLEGGRNKVYIDFKWNTVGKRHVDRSRNNRRKYRKKNS